MLSSAEIIKTLAVGDDIRKWHIRDSDKYLIVTRKSELIFIVIPPFLNI
jgi:hypothetical protein